jgi:hypothetical protein
MRLIDHDTDPYLVEGRCIYQDTQGNFTAYYNGWYEGAFDGYNQALARLFPESTHGYEIEYFFDEGDWLNGPFCAECAAQIWSDEPDCGKVIAEMVNSDQLREGSVWCDGCSKEIAEAVCAECYSPLSETKYGRYHAIFTDGNYYAMHASCIAELVVHGGAKKVGLQQYEVSTNTRGLFYVERY